jgi:hypothetical protein
LLQCWSAFRTCLPSRRVGDPTTGAARRGGTPVG